MDIRVVCATYKLDSPSNNLTCTKYTSRQPNRGRFNPSWDGENLSFSSLEKSIGYVCCDWYGEEPPLHWDMCTQKTPHQPIPLKPHHPHIRSSWGMAHSKLKEIHYMQNPPQMWPCNPYFKTPFTKYRNIHLSNVIRISSHDLWILTLVSFRRIFKINLTFRQPFREKKSLYGII